MQQYMRIEANTDGARLDRAFKAAVRYVNNIKNKKSYKNTVGNSSEKNIDEYFRDLGTARSKQYSQRTYMGLSEG